jgi:pilus assembly protein Flp/PilA
VVISLALPAGSTSTTAAGEKLESVMTTAHLGQIIVSIDIFVSANEIFDIGQISSPNCVVFLSLKICVATEMRDVIKEFWAWVDGVSKRGVTAIEYGLLAALIALAIIVSVTLVGTKLSGLFTYIAGKVVAP